MRPSSIQPNQLFQFELAHGSTDVAYGRAFRLAFQEIPAVADLYATGVVQDSDNHYVVHNAMMFAGVLD